MLLNFKKQGHLLLRIFGVNFPLLPLQQKTPYNIAKYFYFFQSNNF